MNGIIIFVFCGIALVAASDIREIKHAVHPDFPGQCYDHDLQRAFNVNDNFLPVAGICYEGKCSPEFTLYYNGCTSYYLRPGCVVVAADTTQEYPQCCPTIKCPSN